MNDYTFKDYVKEKKERVDEWWGKHGKVIKTGIVCGVIGLGYGFIRGVCTTTKLIVAANNYNPELEQSTDNYVYDENNVDDPELLELIKTELENE